MTQAEGGGTHNGRDQHYAFDFLMPVGTRVVAARPGRVVKVADGTPEGVPWQEDAGNSVYILHVDGTYAEYVHLLAGIPVKVGQEIAAGEFIGYSGHTGQSAAPHLHFGAKRIDTSWEIEAIPVRFGQMGKPGFVPEAGHHAGVIPRSKRTLRSFVDDRAGSMEAPLPLRHGSEARLRVELVAPDGSVRDVTRDERTRCESMTVWNLHCPEAGRLLAKPVHGITPEYVKSDVPLQNQREGRLFVYYGAPKDPDFGLAQVAFEVSIPAAAP